MSKQESEPKSGQQLAWYGEDKLVNGGLIGISLLITQAFISLGKYDIPATISIFAFSIAIPFLACNVIATHVLASDNKNPETRGTDFLFWAGIIASVIGIDATFWHVSWIAGVLLLISGIIGLAIYTNYA